MKRKYSYDDIDNIMDVLNSLEEKERHESSKNQKAIIGKVEHYYSRLGVAGIKLSDTLKLGDIIEIGNEEEAIRQRVTSMQINRENVEEAEAGQSVGIKVKCEVREGSNVYKLYL